jgi:ABC-type lipoprotein release transport system permease subunit
METVPGWVAITAFSTAVILLVLILLPLLFRENRAIFKLGWRYSKSSGGVSIGRALPVSLLVGIILASLSVGDGLNSMVVTNTERNLSEVDIVIEAPGSVPEDILREDGDMIRDLAPIIILNGGARSGNKASSEIRVIGFDERLLDLGSMTDLNGKVIGEIPSGSGVIVNRKASEILGLNTGEWLLVTLDPHDRSEEILPGMTDQGSVRMNLTVSTIVEDKGIGRYREDALDRIIPTCFMDLSMIRERLGIEGVNRFLLKTDREKEEIKVSLEEGLTLEDAGFTVVEASSAGGELIRSDQFLFDARDLDPDNESVQTFSYFVDSISSGESNISYSVVSGMEDLNVPGSGLLRSGEAIINNWTAEQLGLEKGDTITMDFRSADISGKLSQDRRSFSVAEIVNITGQYAERELLPPIEGITDEESCSSWDPGFDIDLDSIRESDLGYWEEFKTTPKVFITLGDAREMWSTPWGDTTSLWIKDPENSVLGDEIPISVLEISIIPVRENALSSSRALSIFPGMFMTFGTAVMASTGLVLLAVIKELSLRRSREWGIMRSLGAGRIKVALFGIYENLRSLIWGSLFGVLLGAVFSYIVNLSLSSIWSDTVEGSEVPLRLTVPSITVAISSAMIISTLLVAFLVIREVRKVPVANTRGEEPGLRASSSRMIPLVTGSLLLLMGVVILFLAIEGGGTFEVAGPFVIGSMLTGSGSALLLAGIVSNTHDLSDRFLIVTSSLSRRPGQTRTGITFMALVLTVALSLSGMGSLLESGLENEKQSYGGGFDMVLETSSGIRDPVSNLEGMELVHLLTYGKEGGTCSNINAVFPPRLVGLPSSLLASNEFDLKEPSGSDRIWNDLLETNGDTVPIIVDENTLRWIYFGDVGSIFEIEPEPGWTVRLEVMGILGPSVLTGTFVMSEENLKRLYPSASGYDLVLVKGETSDSNIGILEREFRDLGPEVVKVESLARENLDYELSYLSLFRDFLVLGVIIAMGALVMFNHNRSLRFSREMVVYRSLGVSRRRARSYLLFENMMVLMISLFGAVMGSALSIFLTWNNLGGDLDWFNITAGMLPVLLILIAISLISSLLSSSIATGDYEDQVPGADA